VLAAEAATRAANPVTLRYDNGDIQAVLPLLTDISATARLPMLLRQWAVESVDHQCVVDLVLVFPAVVSQVLTAPPLATSAVDQTTSRVIARRKP
jgi:hypothetical protein